MTADKVSQASFLPALQGQHFNVALAFLHLLNAFRQGWFCDPEPDWAYDRVLALLTLDLAVAAQLQKSLGGGGGESGQQDEMAAALKDIENSRDMSLVIEAAVREQDPASRKKIVQSIRSGAFGKELVMIDATKATAGRP